MKTLILATLAMFMLSSCEKSGLDLNLDGAFGEGFTLYACRIVDPNNQPIPGAMIEVYSSSNKVACATAISDENGVCHFRKDLNTIRIKVSKAGYQSIGIDNFSSIPASEFTVLLQP